jgi:soluble lytic murein transglycosylase-like protein
MTNFANSSRSLLFLAAATLFYPSAAHSARPVEQATLQNGFTIAYDHRAVVGKKVRLYLDKSEESFIEIRQEEIVSTETLPDPPPDVTPTESKSTPTQIAIRPTSSKKSAPLNTADLHQILKILTLAGNEHNVDVDLLASIVKAESDGNVHAVSHAGAQGLMQLMPATAAAHGVNDSFAPEQNVRGGSAYIDELLTRYHDNLALALAAYNAGPAAVDKYKGIPPYAETRAYVARVIHEFNRRLRAREAAAKAAQLHLASPQQ